MQQLVVFECSGEILVRLTVGYSYHYTSSWYCCTQSKPNRSRSDLAEVLGGFCSISTAADCRMKLSDKKHVRFSHILSHQ